MQIVVLDVKDSIINLLHENPQGLTLNSIAECANLHRHTVRKYIQILLSEQKISVRTVGRAKLCYIR